MSQATDSLVQLVSHVFACQDGLIEGLTYQELASRIGRLNRHGEGHAHGMGAVLGEMGHLLQGLEGEWGEPIPHIQSLVVNKSGPFRGLPDYGIQEFWPDYASLSRTERENRVRLEHQKILSFGSRWNDVLTSLGLPKITSETAGIPRGKGGESEAHRVLKEHVRAHPEIVGASLEWESFVEYALPSMDEIDVVFKSSESCVAVEVKSATSDLFPSDYERGLYQVVKYGALLSAMRKDTKQGIPQEVRAVLVLESHLPEQCRGLASALQIEVIENVKVGK